jgi:hypothetical protein
MNVSKERDKSRQPEVRSEGTEVRRQRTEDCFDGNCGSSAALRTGIKQEIANDEVVGCV